MSVLGNLFSDIATAIRSKTGETGTFSPSDFATKIESIVVGGNSGSGEWNIKQETILATATVMTVEHGLGRVPDIIIIQPRAVVTAGSMLSTGGFSQRFIDYLESETDDDYKGIPTHVVTSTSTGNTGSIYIVPKLGFDAITDDTGESQNWCVRNCTSESFTFGRNGDGGLMVDKYYHCIYMWYTGTFDGSSTGGSSTTENLVEPGVYWQQSPYAVLNQDFRYFTLNGELFKMHRTVGITQSGTKNRNIYKCADGVATLVTTIATQHDPVIESYNTSIAEYNGKTHFVFGKYHCIWDGTTLTEITHNREHSFTPQALCVYEGKLLRAFNDGLYDDDGTGIMYWDETTQTWIEFSSFGGYNLKYIYVYNNKLYCRYNSVIYEYNNGEFIESSNPAIINEYDAVLGDTCYYLKQISGVGYGLYKHNIYSEANTETDYIGLAPYISNIAMIYNINGKINVQGNRTNLFRVEMILTEVEGT